MAKLDYLSAFFTFSSCFTFLTYTSILFLFKDSKELATALTQHDIRISVHSIRRGKNIDLEYMLRQWTVPVGILLNGYCDLADEILKMSSKLMLLDANHAWLVLYTKNEINDSSKAMNYTLDNTFSQLDLSVDADIVAVIDEANHFQLLDIFNFGKIQGNPLEINQLGVWSREKGLEIFLDGFKYYFRWDFHNLTLRAVSVIICSGWHLLVHCQATRVHCWTKPSYRARYTFLFSAIVILPPQISGGRPAEFTPSILSERRHTTGVAAFTKITAQILEIFAEMHNFRFNYTIVELWVGNPKRNSTPAVTNTLFWREQDISVTCLRIFPQWLQWMDPYFPPTTFLETRFYYLIPNDGIGDFENRFLTPLSPSVWWCTLASGISCGILLTIAAIFEKRPSPGYYAFFSVMAAACQQAYEDGVQLLEDAFSGQGRRIILLVLGLTSMLIYNYYTSSVVSWLLNAAAPTIATMDALIGSTLELTFEDIGYSRLWLESPGFYYYAGFKREKEDELREKKVKYAKRTVPLLQSPTSGIDLIRTGKYAYHTEPYTASQIIGPKLNDQELCELGSLQMIPRTPIYIVGQKNSPYRQFFIWSLTRALERGHIQAARLRVIDKVPGCSGKTPRSLALGQAAPAFAVLAYAMIGVVVMLGVEIWWFRYQKNTYASVKSKWVKK